MINWIKNKIKIQKKLYDLLLLLTDSFEEINISENGVEVKLNKKFIFKSDSAISLNTSSVIILNADKLHFNPVKISSIGKEDLETYNEI